MLTDRTQIKDWLDERCIGGYTIQDDNTVDVFGNVLFDSVTTKYVAYDDTCEELPIQFGRISGSFRIRGLSNLSSIKGIPRRVDNILDIRYAKIKSLAGIDKIVEHVEGQFLFNGDCTNMLGIALIKHIGSIHIKVPMSFPGDVQKLVNLLDKYKNTGDILSLQDALLDAGLKDQASL